MTTTICGEDVWELEVGALGLSDLEHYVVFEAQVCWGHGFAELLTCTI